MRLTQEFTTDMQRISLKESEENYNTVLNPQKFLFS